MFLNIFYFENVPQYPGYQGYQLFPTLFLKQGMIIFLTMLKSTFPIMKSGGCVVRIIIIRTEQCISALKLNK